MKMNGLIKVKDFEKHIPIGSKIKDTTFKIFEQYSRGLETGRDPYATTLLNLN